MGDERLESMFLSLKKIKLNNSVTHLMYKRPVKLIKQVKIAQTFLQSV